VRACHAEDIRLHVHALHGGAGNIGAMRLSKVAFDLEKKASQEDLSNAEDLLERIEMAFPGLSSEKVKVPGAMSRFFLGNRRIQYYHICIIKTNYA